MKLMLSELQRDLRHRMAVYAKTATADQANEAKRHALLQNSQLWRLLQVVFYYQTSQPSFKRVVDGFAGTI